MRVGARQSIRQHGDLRAVELGDVRMHVRHVGGRLGQACRDLGFLPLQLLHPHLHGGLVHPVFDGPHDALDRALDLLEGLAVDFSLGAALLVLPVGVLHIGAHRPGHGIGRNELVLQARQSPALDHLPGHRAVVVARATPVVVQAAIALPRDDPVLAAAAAASEQPGQQEGRPAQAVDALRPCLPYTDGRWLELLRKLGLTILGGTPERVIDDAQVRNLCSDPFGLGVWPRDTPAGARVFDVALPVPDEHAGIELVVENAGAAGDVPPDRRIAPGAAKRTGNALMVQVGRDRPWAPSGREFAEDAPDDQRLGLVDRTLSAKGLAFAVGALDDIIAIAESPTRLALLDTPLKTAMGLGREVLQKQRVHCAFQPDVQLRDFAFGQGDDLHAGKAQMLEQSRDIGLVPGDAVERLGQHEVELPLPGVLQERLHAGSQGHAGARDSRILIGVDDAPLLPRSVFAADPELVVDRGDALIVGRVAGVERGLGHGSIPFHRRTPLLRRCSLNSRNLSFTCAKRRGGIKP